MCAYKSERNCFAWSYSTSIVPSGAIFIIASLFMTMKKIFLCYGSLIILLMKGISVDFTASAKNTFVLEAAYNVIVRYRSDNIN